MAQFIVRTPLRKALSEPNLHKKDYVSVDEQRVIPGCPALSKRKLHVQVCSALGIDYALKDKAAWCDRCLELRIPSITLRWPMRKVHSAIGVVPEPMILQRLLFDDNNVGTAICHSCAYYHGSQCPGCREIFERISSLRFAPSRDQAGHCTPELEFKIDSHNDYSTTKWKLLSSSGVHGSIPRNFGVVEPNQSYVATARSVGPWIDYDLLSRCLRHCLRYHHRCADRQSQSGVDLRVIDVTQKRLILRPEGVPYLALSYVWGGGKQPHVLGLGALPIKLPLTIEDAIKVTQRLGFRCLWVDSICIDQQDTTEKGRLIEAMDSIYEGATATIIVLDSPNADSGMPRLSQCLNQQVEQREQSSVWFGDKQALSFLPSLRAELASSTWDTRAWTFQEGLLSKRRLIFTKNQVHFVCDMAEESEDGQETVAKSEQQPIMDLARPFMNFSRLPSINAACKGPVYPYMTLIMAYMARKMTNASDALHAISGTLTRMTQTILPHGFLYGLPRCDLRQALLWTAWNINPSVPQYGVFPKRRDIAGLPSWSWAAWEMPCRAYWFSTRLRHSWTQGDVLPPLELSSGEGVLDPDLAIECFELWEYDSTATDQSPLRPHGAVFGAHVRVKMQLESVSPGPAIDFGPGSVGECILQLYARARKGHLKETCEYSNDPSILQVTGLLLKAQVSPKDQASLKDSASLKSSAPASPTELPITFTITPLDIDVEYEWLEYKPDLDPTHLVSNASSTTLDLLWISTWLSSYFVYLDLIVLVWDGAKATRAGVVAITLPYEVFRRIAGSLEIEYRGFMFG